MITKEQEINYNDYILNVYESLIPYLAISTNKEISNFQDKLSKGLVTEKHNYLYYLQEFRGKPLDYVGIKYMGRPLSTIAFANLFDAYTGFIAGTPEVCRHAYTITKLIDKYKRELLPLFSSK